MSERMRLSIAMAVYNGERFIREQLESYLAQTRLPDELVVSDNASTDRTREIVLEFAKRAPFEVKLNVNETNLGTCRNFERAFMNCTGDIIFWSDCDDVWHPRKVEAVEEVFLEHPKVGVVCHDAEMIDERGRPIGLTLWRASNFRLRKLTIYPPGKATFTQLCRWSPPLFGMSMAMRRSAIAHFLPSPLNPNRKARADLDGWLGLLSAASWERAALPLKLAYYRRHPQQFSSQAAFTLSEKVRKRKELVIEDDEVRLFSEVAKRLEATDPAIAAVAQTMSGFLQFRQSLCSLPKLRRVIPVLSQLLSGNYHNFTPRPYLSALKDLAFVSYLIR